MLIESVPHLWADERGWTLNMLIQAAVKLPPHRTTAALRILHCLLLLLVIFSFLIFILPDLPGSNFFISLSENLGSRSKIKVPTTGLNWPQLMLLITRYRVTNLSLSLWVWFCFVEILIIWIITWAHFICKIYMKCSYIPVLGQCWWDCTLQPDERHVSHVKIYVRFNGPFSSHCYISL